MIGKNAARVEFDYEGLSERRYSQDLFNIWQADMKKAIDEDLIDEGLISSKVIEVASIRYVMACEDLIIDLIFWVKCGHARINPSDRPGVIA